MKYYVLLTKQGLEHVAAVFATSREEAEDLAAEYYCDGDKKLFKEKYDLTADFNIPEKPCIVGVKYQIFEKH